MSTAKSALSEPHILVVDDDQRIRTLVGRYLNENGFITTLAESAATARNLVGILIFDAIVLDIMMPGEDGLSLLTDWQKKRFETPVLLLTAKNETESRIQGLEFGADDYLPKPFEPRELVLRLKAILRRHHTVPPSFDAEQIPTVAGWHVDLTRQLLKRENEIESLTKAEATLLGIFLQKPGVAFSRTDLARLTALEGQERTIDVQVTRLRRKIEPDPKKPRYLQTVRGEGYVLYGDI